MDRVPLSGASAHLQAAGGGEGLNVLHHRLEAHFRGLRERRDLYARDIPLFALEHGLTEAELVLLMAEVRSAVQRRHLPRESWLPLVVYAAEVGYDYSGDEYWQTFESRTPGWAQLADRDLLRRRFRQFSDLFGGAKPTGAWARHFSIIAWPITHAVLPTDLQRQLARLLFEYRTALTSDLIADPNTFGARLAARSWHYSSRFQNFAQNRSLLGQVAAALLVGDDEESPYLLESTLRRIVKTLSVEREARRWLHDAKSSASRVRVHGFRPSDRIPSPGTTSSGRQRLPSVTDPTILLRRESAGWVGYLDLPDLSVLAEWLPDIHRDLDRLRARIEGVSGPPLARGRLLYPGQRLRLDQWPDYRSPLIQLEAASQAVNGLLADQCVLSPGPRWLFRIRESGLAVEVRGKFARPGHAYILISESPVEPDLPSWANPVGCATAGVQAVSLDVPAPLETVHVEQLGSLGLAVAPDVEVRPAGIVASGWNGEGEAEWLAGEDAVVAVRSTRAIAQCIFTVDGEPRLLDWPKGNEEIFVAISHLEVGSHDVQVSLLHADVEEPVANGSLLVAIRGPHSRPSSGTFREGLMIIATPAKPTLGELWGGRAGLQVIGPPDARVSIQIALADKNNVILNRHRFHVTLPIDMPEWSRVLARELRDSSGVHHFYDDTESCAITASHPGLGTARLRCEREFTPLRWIVGRDRDGPFVRLINNTEGGSVDIERSEFATPAHAARLETAQGERLRWPSGGLIRARAADVESSVILPPLVRDFTELRLAQVTPHIPTTPRTADGTLRLINLARMWESASLPADPFVAGPRRAVLRAMTSRLVGLIAGQRWSRMEERVARDDGDFTLLEMQEAVGEETHQRALARAIRGELYAWRAIEAERRSEGFAAVLAVYRQRADADSEDVRLAEFLLRLASVPASLGISGEVRSWLELTLVSPVLVRAARFLVLAIHALEKDDGATYRGWSWS